MSDEKKEQWVWSSEGKWVNEKWSESNLLPYLGKIVDVIFWKIWVFPSENGIQMGPRRKDILIAPVRNFWTTNLERKWVLGREREFAMKWNDTTTVGDIPWSPLTVLRAGSADEITTTLFQILF